MMNSFHAVPWTTVIACLIVASICIFVGRLFIRPLRWLLRTSVTICGSIFIGWIILFLFNVVAHYAQFNVPVNPITALVVGLLKVPGLLLLIALRLVG